jgi:hypothetical protein
MLEEQKRIEALEKDRQQGGEPPDNPQNLREAVK